MARWVEARVACHCAAQWRARAVVPLRCLYAPRATAGSLPTAPPCRDPQVYAKRPAGSGGDPLDVRPYKERVLEVRNALAGLPYPHVWPVQRLYETERAVLLVRQFLAANLAQRISTRPFLTLVEKVGAARRAGRERGRTGPANWQRRRATQNTPRSRGCACAARGLHLVCHPSPCAHTPRCLQRWIAYQLLLAVAQCHAAGVCHGDIKSENVALSSWDWAFLLDFAPYKPTLLPADNPADFSFFFDTTGRRWAPRGV